MPPTLAQLVARRLSRRQTLSGLAVALVLGLRPRLAARELSDEPARVPGFEPLGPGSDGRLHVARGHRARVLLAWGDPLHEGQGPFDPAKLTPEEQARRFGANADWIGLLPLEGAGEGAEDGAGERERLLLAVNHEFAEACMMRPGLARKGAAERLSERDCRLEMEAIGLTLVELERGPDGWRPRLASRLNRRISASTEIALSGPAAGDERLRTKEDPEGRLVIGTFNNCAGGTTPWGTVLSCEENFNWHFGGACEDSRERANHARYQVGEEQVFGWHRYFPRFDLAREPREPNRFGWVVEIDPRDPASVPVKRSALGRFKHEGATVCLAPDGRAVVYSGDDDEFEHLYRFVSARAFDPREPAAQRDLLDSGTLSVARLAEDGSLAWIPLVHGAAPLDEEHGFRSQADVLIETRRAATLVGATPLDRPEDVEVHPGDGRVLVMLTKNNLRKEAALGSPRAPNRAGHVLELVPPLDETGRADHAAERFAWGILLVGGEEGGLSCPDNAAFDPAGGLWIATDGEPAVTRSTDGLWAVGLDGEERGRMRRFLRGPLGCEICGPCFSPDGRTLLVAVQHPGSADESGRTRAFSFDAPSCRWPDERADRPPRAAVVLVEREDGAPIGA